MDKQRPEKTYMYQQKRSCLQKEEKRGWQWEVPNIKAGNAETAMEGLLAVCWGHCYSPGGQYFRARELYETILDLHQT